MCYMAGSNPHRRDERVGVRELRQNLSVYLRRIRDGEAFTVTERGTPVARLAAISEHESVLDRLVAEGKARPPRATDGGFVLPDPLPVEPAAPSMAEILDELREDRI